MGLWTVYMVRCADDSLYTGISTDVAARLKLHNSGKGAKYTRSRRPVRLVWRSVRRSGSAARRLEAELKSWTKPQKEALVRRGSLRRAKLC